MDYKKLGFKCGLEIHQQVEGKKLFCNCPTTNSTAKADIHVERRLRAVVGEQGELDKAALAEMVKGRKYIYESDSSDTCLVDYDEEPPHSINPEAVKAAVQAAKMMNARIADEVQVMRKTVVDGSNVSGFQRTALVAMDGFIDTSKGKVKIDTICVEEEAAQKKEEGKDYVLYRIDRLGIPLLEIATSADIIDPEHAKETAEKIGLILRSTGKMKRGIGTIRQDVNVSIKGHPRVEIKGFQDLRSIPKVIDFEISRQQKEKKGESHVRKAEADGTTSFLRPMPGAARMYPETDVMPLRIGEVKVEEVEMISDKIKRYTDAGLAEDIAKKIAKRDMSRLIDELISLKNVKITYAVDVVLGAEPNIKKQYGKEVKLTGDNFKEVLSKLDSGEIGKDSVLEILFNLGEGKKVDYAKYKGADDSEIEKAVKKVVAANKGAPVGALMGMCMKELRGKADGKKVMEMIKKLTK